MLKPENGMEKFYRLKPAYGKTDLFYAGYNDYRGGNYKTADSIFQMYQTKFPEDAFGWYLGALQKKELIQQVN